MGGKRRMERKLDVQNVGLERSRLYEFRCG